jgi:hypothetical protein
MRVVPSSPASIGPVTVSTEGTRGLYVRTLQGVPRSWLYSMIILVLALIASMVIALINLI